MATSGHVRLQPHRLGPDCTAQTAVAAGQRSTRQREARSLAEMADSATEMALLPGAAHHLGCAFVAAFRVVATSLPQQCEGVELLVRGVDPIGRIEDLSSAACVRLLKRNAPEIRA